MMPRLCSQGMEPRLFQDVLDQLHLRLLDAYTICRVLRLESDESKEFEAEHHQADGWDVSPAPTWWGWDSRGGRGHCRGS